MGFNYFSRASFPRESLRAPRSYNNTTNVIVNNIIEKDNINPDPSKYTITKHQQIGKYLLVELNYPNCTNYEGNKILLFENTTIKKLIKQKYIDPHFFKNKKYQAPIARFVPTEEGWLMGLELMRNRTNEK